MRMKELTQEAGNEEQTIKQMLDWALIQGNKDAEHPRTDMFKKVVFGVTDTLPDSQEVFGNGKVMLRYPSVGFRRDDMEALIDTVCDGFLYAEWETECDGDIVVVAIEEKDP